jgi:hypothetical protein
MKKAGVITVSQKIIMIISNYAGGDEVISHQENTQPGQWLKHNRRYLSKQDQAEGTTLGCCKPHTLCSCQLHTMNSVKLRTLSGAAEEGVLCQAREAQEIETVIMEFGVMEEVTRAHHNIHNGIAPLLYQSFADLH